MFCFAGGRGCDTFKAVHSPIHAVGAVKLLFVARPQESSGVVRKYLEEI